MSHVKFVSPDSLGPNSEWEHIGQGHFGDVFKVKHKVLHIHVAVKQLKDPSYRLEELLDEAEKIKHASANDYVIQLHGIVKVPPCIIMQWMEYGCLGTLMERVKVIPWPFKYRILHEVALGMNWLHLLSLLHLDLKPGNVLLNDALHIRIGDFGLSRFTSSSTALGDIEAVGGTLAYMPPEAFQEGYKPSESTDIYSFAILSAVVLKGDDPYPIDNSSMIRMSISDGQRPSFESLENISFVKNLDKAIAFTKSCWDRDKQKRPSFGGK
ncbi:PREDICTED: ankyrin repeat and protein kinase domain-containing protein 1-like [Nanorana parkeri]|uniref:ankyrin repeat and protein kinase domain-containing protein 1-like n=1 Tax=Nanorana parkeri TaxID=125878 RepID=UPI000854ECE9|nr:PREDICTED: ankyrin repeat and protein kinase domain-containing protein 1-like [Nanorana parkeri]